MPLQQFCSISVFYITSIIQLAVHYRGNHQLYVSGLPTCPGWVAYGQSGMVEPNELGPSYDPPLSGAWSFEFRWSGRFGCHHSAQHVGHQERSSFDGETDGI